MRPWLKKMTASVLAATLVLPTGLASAATKFPDVNPNTVTPDVQQAIEALAEQGIIQGFPDGTFGPNKSITRAQFGKILAQIKGLQPNPAAAAQFTDVKDPEQQGWVGALVAAGLTTGTTATTYSPNRPIQRDQAATFLVRALGLEEVAKALSLTPTTTDGARIHASHKANVGLLEKIGLVKGYPNGAYGPGDPFKRQQAANLLYNIQQNGDRYVEAAQALLHRVDVVHNQDGTLTVKGSLKRAATVDIVLREAGAGSSDDSRQRGTGQENGNQEGKVILEQKGVKTTANGSFEWTSSERFVLPAQYVLSVTGYDEAGQVAGQLERDVQIEQGVVQGLTEAPDLIHVYAEGKFVYYVFDEPIHRVQDEKAFFIVTYVGKISPAKDVDVQKDGVTVKAEFSGSEVRRSTLAGVTKQAVMDKEWHESIEALLPLHNAEFGGTTEAPDLLSVKVEPFQWKEDDNASIVVEYVFDKEIQNVDPSKFLLFLKDGTKLVGTDIVREKKESVTVQFDVEWDSTTDTVTSGDGTKTSTVLRDFGGVIDRVDIAVAAVEPEAVTDDKRNPNPLNAVDVRAKLGANQLQQAEADFDKGILKFIFDYRVEGVLSDTYALQHLAVVEVSTGKTKTLADVGVAQNDIEIDGRTVTVEFSKTNLDHSQALIELAGVAVAGFLDSSEERERLVPGFVSIQRSYAAGETYAPTLKNMEVDYVEKEGLLTVQFDFSMKIKETADAAQRFKLYDVTGKEIDAEVFITDVKDETITVEFEIDEADWEQAVVVAVEQGAVTANDDFKVGSESGKKLLNPAFHVPLKP